ncbi:MAG: hypothetical protein AB7N76_03275 [Planctomycetota bacterium]
MPRPLDDILLELEEIEGTSANLDDPEADYEDRIARPDELVEEAARLGEAALELVGKRLIEAKDLPQEVGYLQRRPFLAKVLGRLAPAQPEQALAIVVKLPPADVKLVVAALPDADAPGTLTAWFLARARFAKTVGESHAGLRRYLLEALKARGPLADEVKQAAAADPDAEVQKLGK